MRESEYKTIIRYYRSLVLADRSLIDDVAKHPRTSPDIRAKAEKLLYRHEVLSVRFICDMTEVPAKGQTELIGVN